MDIKKIVAIMFQKINPNDTPKTTVEFICQDDFEADEREHFEAFIRELLSGDYKLVDGVSVRFLTDYTFEDNTGCISSN